MARTRPGQTLSVKAPPCRPQYRLGRRGPALAQSRPVLGASGPAAIPACWAKPIPERPRFPRAATPSPCSSSTRLRPAGATRGLVLLPAPRRCPILRQGHFRCGGSGPRPYSPSAAPRSWACSGRAQGAEANRPSHPCPPGPAAPIYPHHPARPAGLTRHVTARRPRPRPRPRAPRGPAPACDALASDPRAPQDPASESARRTPPGRFRGSPPGGRCALLRSFRNHARVGNVDKAGITVDPLRVHTLRTSCWGAEHDAPKVYDLRAESLELKEEEYEARSSRPARLSPAHLCPPGQAIDYRVLVPQGGAWKLEFF